jgi:hypothetical protein
MKMRRRRIHRAVIFSDVIPGELFMVLLLHYQHRKT